jgi:hypothetical protein
VKATPVLFHSQSGAVAAEAWLATVMLMAAAATLATKLTNFISKSPEYTSE